MVVVAVEEVDLVSSVQRLGRMEMREHKDITAKLEQAHQVAVVVALAKQAALMEQDKVEMVQLMIIEQDQT